MANDALMAYIILKLIAELIKIAPDIAKMLQDNPDINWEDLLPTAKQDIKDSVDKIS